MAVEIRCRYANYAYVATSPKQKQTASSTQSPRYAAEALARKLGLNPAQLVEQQRDLLAPADRVLFVHPGELASQPTKEREHE